MLTVRDSVQDSDSLRSHIYQLRQVLDKPFASETLKTVHGIDLQVHSENSLTCVTVDLSEVVRDRGYCVGNRLLRTLGVFELWYCRFLRPGR